jgi:hypothetical protein
MKRVTRRLAALSALLPLIAVPTARAASVPGLATGRESTVDDLVPVVGDQSDRLDLGSELLPDTLSSS